MDDDPDTIERIRRRLLDNAFLYNDAESYSAGVVVTLEALAAPAATQPSAPAR